jgi:hypothetical protein
LIINRRAPTTLYRFFDGAGRLLYVGISGELPKRLTTHNRRQPWWRKVARSTYEHFETREAAREAERKAIRGDHPRFNRADVVPPAQLPLPMARRPRPRAVDAAPPQDYVTEADTVAFLADALLARLREEATRERESA